MKRPEHAAARGLRAAALAAGLAALALVAPSGGAVAQTPAPAMAFSDCGACPEMVVVPAGEFVMGSPENEAGRHADEGPRRRVAIGRAFALGRYEVTFAEWDACAAAGGCPGRPPDAGWGRGGRPVINVDWADARTYARWLARHTGRAYRLPSEAEWEYAARAGKTTARYWGETIEHNRANCAGCGSRWDDDSTAPVGSFAPSPFGLHDMLGNVWEWVEDCWSDGYAGAPGDGRARTSEDCRVRLVRGASWFNEVRIVRVANRLALDPRFRSSNVGFRVALTLP